MISVCINVDTRSGFQDESSNAEHMFEGCRSDDFIIDGVLNKIKFFEGFEIETIVFVDEHEKVPQDILNKLREIADTVVVRRHTHEPNFNDFTYISTLALCRGEYIAHFDQDTAAFTSSAKPIDNLLRLLEDYKYISYPSYWSPNPVHDDSFNYWWVSTRFFMCKRDTIDFTEILKCQRDCDYYVDKYKPSRVCHWTEHILGMAGGKSVFYPPMEIHSYAIFSWGSYKKGVMNSLNNCNYDQIINFIAAHPIQYPNDIHI
jgi:hypothetical protein